MRQGGTGTVHQHKTNTTPLSDGQLTRFQHGRNGIPRYAAARLVTWGYLVTGEVCPVQACFRQLGAAWKARNYRPSCKRTVSGSNPLTGSMFLDVRKRYRADLDAPSARRTALIELPLAAREAGECFDSRKICGFRKAI